MALHYFHIANGSTALDAEGTDLPDLNAVQKEALRMMREVVDLGINEEKLWVGEAFKVWVTTQPNGAGRTLLTLELNART